MGTFKALIGKAHSKKLLLLTTAGIFALFITSKLLPGWMRELGFDQYLGKKLTAVDSVKAHGIFDAAYILGGSPGSLKLKFRKAAFLFHKGRCKKILIAHRPGKTGYRPELQRNLLNDEWSLRQMSALGVPAVHIEIVKIKEGFFGTFAEARSIAALARKRKYKNLLLITAPHHTRRTRLSFQYWLQSSPTKVSVLASREKAGFIELFSEIIKLEVYKIFLISSVMPHAEGRCNSGWRTVTVLQGICGHSRQLHALRLVYAANAMPENSGITNRKPAEKSC